MFGDRIKRARKALGLSLRKLGEKMELSHAAIKKYEDNKVTPSSEALIKLAHILEVKVEYFFRPAHLTLNKPQYRKHPKLPKRELEEINAKISDTIERRFELESLFPSALLQTFSITNLPKKIKHLEDMEIFADQIRMNWNLGLEPLPNLIDIFEEHGIKVFEINNQLYPKFDGLCDTINDTPFIVIGNQWPGDRQRFTLAHELGHLILDKRLPHNADEESYCNRFAAAFLLPKSSFLSILGKHRNHIEPRELSLIKQEFGISMSSILHRAHETNIISDNLYKRIRTKFQSKRWLTHEPGEQYPKETTHIFEQMIFHAVAEEYITISRAAELMDITLESFRSLRAMENKNAALCL